MKPIMFDEALIAKAVEVSDSAGNAVAMIVPKVDLADYEELGPEISDDELVRRMKTKRRYTKAKILQMLRGQ